MRPVGDGFVVRLYVTPRLRIPAAAPGDRLSPGQTHIPSRPAPSSLTKCCSSLDPSSIVSGPSGSTKRKVTACGSAGAGAPSVYHSKVDLEGLASEHGVGVEVLEAELDRVFEAPVDAGDAELAPQSDIEVKANKRAKTLKVGCSWRRWGWRCRALRDISDPPSALLPSFGGQPAVTPAGVLLGGGGGGRPSRTAHPISLSRQSDLRRPSGHREGVGAL